MKKLVTILLTLFPLIAIAQLPELVLTKEGFFNKRDLSKTYVVYDVENTNKDVLFQRVLVGITKLYKSSKDVVSKVDNEAITINATQRNEVPCKGLKYDLHYTFSISFKDNKIKLDVPTFNCETFAYGKPYRLIMSGSNGGFGSDVTVGLFKKDGKPGQEKTIEYLETFFNLLYLQIIKSAVNDQEATDW